MKRHPVRAVFHLFLFCLLLSFLASSARLLQWRGKAFRLADALGEHFGGISVTEKGVLPLKNAETPATFILTPKIRLTYLPPDSTETSAQQTISSKEQFQIFWAQRGFLLTMRVPGDPDSFMLFHLPVPGTALFMHSPQDLISYQHFTAKETVEYLEKNYALKKGEGLVHAVPEILLPHGIVNFLAWTAWLSILITVDLFLFCLAFITILIFSLVQLLWKTPGYSQLKFRNIFAIMLYSAFPALGGSALFLAFPLPFLNFETVFFIIFFFYHLFAFRSVFRFLNPPKNRNNDNEPQDFF